MIVDVHNHALPAVAREWLRQEGEAVGVELTGDLVTHSRGFRWEIEEGFVAPAALLAGLKARGTDGALISAPPPFLLHEAPVAPVAEFVDQLNSGLFEMAGAHEDRLRVLCSVVLQEPERAASQVAELGENELCAGFQVGVSFDGPALHEPVYAELWQAVARSGLLLFIHPVYEGPAPGLDDRYLTNVVGNPVLTTATAMRLIDSGLLKADPAPRVLLAHGGGFLPYQLGRLAHASEVRPELGVRPEEVRKAIRSFYYDTITHDAGALAFLIERAGSDRILLGTDAPFDMADEDPVGTVRAACERVLAEIGEANPKRLLGSRALGGPMHPQQRRDETDGV